MGFLLAARRVDPAVLAHLMWRRGRTWRCGSRATGAWRLRGAPGCDRRRRALAVAATGAYAYHNIKQSQPLRDLKDEAEKYRRNIERKYLNTRPAAAGDHALSRRAAVPEESGGWSPPAATTSRTRRTRRSATSMSARATAILEFTRSISAARGCLRRQEIRLSHLPVRPAAGARSEGGMTFSSQIWHRGFKAASPATDIIENGTFANNFEFAPVIGMNQTEPAQRPRQAPPPGTSARAAAGQARGHVGDRTQLYRQRLGDVGHHADDRRRPDADRAGQPGVGRHEWRTADGAFRQRRADPQFLLDPVGRYEVAQRRSQRDQLSVYYHQGPRLERAEDAERDGRRRSIITGPTSGPISSTMRGSSNSRATPASPRRSPGRCLIRNRSASTPTPRSRQDRLTTYVDRARNGAPMLGAPGDRRGHAGRDDDQRDARAIFGADGDEAPLRAGQDPPVPQVRARSLPAGRQGEVVEEVPLERVENQAYIHYRKGSIVMYLLQERLGEDAVNRALARLLASVRFKGAPYERSIDLVAEFRKEAKTPEQQQLITDLFEKITLYDLKVSDASTRGRRRLDDDADRRRGQILRQRQGRGDQGEARRADRGRAVHRAARARRLLGQGRDRDGPRAGESGVQKIVHSKVKPVFAASTPIIFTSTATATTMRRTSRRASFRRMRPSTLSVRLTSTIAIIASPRRDRPGSKPS